ncbi:MAG: hypothetical protein RBT45_01125 [Acholeplasmataceae bacterium]|nr:hypothetical protein [Acholeplasmataceae bacterium]
MSIEKQIKKTRSMVSVSTYKRPRLFVILTMVCINVIILVIAAVIAMMIDPEINHFLPAFGHSIKWLITPNAILEIEHTETLVLATLVFVIGLILFSGTIIALTTNAIKEYFQKKETNSGKIYLEDHIVILNYNSKVPELVSDLLYIGNKDLNILILSENDKSFIEKQLLNELKKDKKMMNNLSNVRLLVKQGSPLLKTDLDDISIENAQSILIMNKDDQLPSDDAHSDMNVIKTVLGLSDFSMQHRQTIVCEVKHLHSKQKILSLKDLVHGLKEHEVIPVCFDRRLGQMMAQTILDNKMDDLYLSLFSFQGSEVYLLENHQFDDVMMNHSHAIPLEQNNNDLYVLAEEYQDAYERAVHKFDVKPLKSKPWIEKDPNAVYIIGSNNKLQFIMDSFDQYENLYQKKYPMTLILDHQIDEMIRTLNDNQLESTILLLSDEYASSDAIDANVISTLIDIQRQLKNNHVHILVELLEPKNERLIQDFKIEKTIISNKIISLLLSKLAMFPKTADFYEQLLTISPSAKGKDDYALTIKSAKESFDELFPLTFSSKKQLIFSAYLARKKEAVLIGFFRDDQMHIFSKNLHEEEHIIVLESDLLIWMKR